MKIISNLPDTDAGTTERPDGALADVSAPAAGDGTPAREDWLNDIFYALLAVMEDAGVSADDSDEEVEAGTGASQFLEALRLFGSTDMQTESANFTYTDADLKKEHTHVDVTTAASTIVGTLPAPSAINTGKKVTLYKIDSGAGIIRATASFKHLGISQATIDIELEGSGITFISNGTNWLVDREIGLEIENISGTLESVYKKYLNGNLSGGATTSVAHGISDHKKIIEIFAVGLDDGGAATEDYYFSEIFETASASNDKYIVKYDATNVVFSGVGANLQGNDYKIRIRYYI